MEVCIIPRLVYRPNAHSFPRSDCPSSSGPREVRKLSDTPEHLYDEMRQRLQNRPVGTLGVQLTGLRDHLPVVPYRPWLHPGRYSMSGHNKEQQKLS